MITYVALGLLVLISVILLLRYRAAMKGALSQQQLDKLVLSILKHGQRDLE